MQKIQARLDLKKGKEKPVLHKHHWIFSGAVKKISPYKPGDIAEVFSSENTKLGLAILNQGHSITAHMLCFGQESIEEAVYDRIAKAFSFRKRWFDPSITNSYRLINAEGDAIPGLIVDSYADVLVMQISHPGIERLKDLIVENLVSICKPRAIIEKSTSFLRKKEGLTDARSHIWGEDLKSVEVLENGLLYSVDLYEGQKTGFFLDQRESRKMIAELSKDKKVLNCFAYTGGFSVAALSGQAKHVDSVEISAKCQSKVDTNISLNKLDTNRHRFICEDVFDFLKTCSWDYDIVILDPPAFVKKREDIAQAFRAYKDINAQAIRNMAPNTLLLTCSCSYHVEEELFQNILFRAALEANRSVKIISTHKMAYDHLVSIYHPESAYLKSFLLLVE